MPILRRTINLVLMVSAGVALTLGGSGVLAHSEPPYNGPPPPPPPPPRAAVRVDHVPPLRWSWLHWWEANRDLYLAPLVQARKTQEGGAPEAAETRGRVVQALIGGLADPAPGARASCALALGRLRETTALASFEAVAAGDGATAVRAQTLIALGLVGEPSAQRFLLGQKYPTDTDFTAAILGLGGIRQPTRPALDGLERIARQRSPLANAALWSLRQHSDEHAARIAERTVRSSRDPWLVSEALLTLGRATVPNAPRILAEIAVQTPDAQQLPVWRLLQDVKQEKARAIMAAQTVGGAPIDEVAKRWRRAHDRWYSVPPAMSVTWYTAPLPTPPIMGGIEDLYMARLRAAAAIAMGDLGAAAPVAALREVLNERMDDHNIVPKCFAAISLGRLGAPDALPDLMQIVDADAARRAQQSEWTESPLRGFAALALGLYARPVSTVQGAQDRPRYDDAITLLLDRLGDSREKPEMRSACAVALGLTGRTAVIKPMFTLADQLTGNDVPVLGYVLLARAMLGDSNIVEPARRALALPRHRDEMTDLLTRRATVLALGVLGQRDVVPVLVQAWNEPYYVNREVILALSLCGAAGASEAILPRLRSDNEYECAYMATTLGHLLSEWPPPLTPLLAGSNFTMQDAMMRSYRVLANEFFATYLLEQFDRPWY